MTDDEKPKPIPSLGNLGRFPQPPPMRPPLRRPAHRAGATAQRQYGHRRTYEPQRYMLPQYAQYQQFTSPFGQNPMQILENNMHVIASMIASANGALLPSKDTWGHLNPNFDFGRTKRGGFGELDFGQMAEGEMLDGDRDRDRFSERAAAVLPIQSPLNPEGFDINARPSEKQLASVQGQTFPSPFDVPIRPDSPVASVSALPDLYTAQERAEIVRRQNNKWDDLHVEKPLGDILTQGSGVQVSIQNKIVDNRLVMKDRQREAPQRAPKFDMVESYLDRNIPIPADRLASRQSPPDYILEPRVLIGAQPDDAPLFLEMGMSKEEKQEVKERVAQWHRARILEIHQKLVEDKPMQQNPIDSSWSTKRHHEHDDKDEGRLKRVRLEEPASSALAGYGFSGSILMVLKSLPAVMEAVEDLASESAQSKQQFETVAARTAGNDDADVEVVSPTNASQSAQILQSVPLSVVLDGEAQDVHSRLDHQYEQEKGNLPVPPGEWILDGLLDSLAR